MIRVQREEFDIAAEIAALKGRDGEIGAVATFTGYVRELHAEASDQSMTLEHYPGMTERALEEIEAEAQARWPLSGSLIIHRFGRLEPHDQIVLVATASRHRGAAFESCQFIMDFLKTRAPFWKLEEADGEGAWVDARDADDQARERWER